MFINVLKQLVLFIAFLSLPAYSLEQFSVSKSEMTQFKEACTQSQDKAEIVKEVYYLLLNKRSNNDKNIKNKITKALSFFSKSKTKNINFDGMMLTDFPAYDLEVLNILTIHSFAKYDFSRSDYPIEKRIVGDTTYIKRNCESLTCKDRNLKNVFSLEKYSDNSACKDVLCASKKIFGENKGPKILWAYLKYGITLSSFVDVNGDPEGFDEDTIDAIIMALKITPVHLQEATTQGAIFYRFLKGQTLAIYGQNNGIIANAFGSVFDAIDKYSTAEKIYIFTHELGHRAEGYKSQHLEKSDEWKSISKSDNAVSLYSKTSATEDFAETYALYRLNGKRLKETSPLKYKFMKERVFEGTEYLSNSCVAD